MISIKEAALKAAEFCQDLYSESQDFLLEEVELNEADGTWVITISFLGKKAMPAGSAMSATLFSAMGPAFERHYKTLKVDAKTGNVISMKIRELQL